MQEKTRAGILICIIGLLLSASITAYIVLQRTAGADGSSYCVRIMQDGTCIEKIDLSKVEEPYEITVESDSGGHNTIEIRPGSVGILDADCPDQLCKKQGFIEDGSIPIVCLPNRLVIELEKSDDVEEELDAVTQ